MPDSESIRDFIEVDVRDVCCGRQGIYASEGIALALACVVMRWKHVKRMEFIFERKTMNLIRTTICQIVIVLAMTGCMMQKDVSVKFHFNPPFSFHTADFRPVALNADHTVTYSIPSFHKIDKRYSGMVVSLLVKCPDNEKAGILSDLQQVSVSVIIRNKSGDVIWEQTAKLGDLRHKFIKGRTVDIRLPAGVFSETDPDSITLKTTTLEPKNNLTGYSLSVRLQELRGK